MRLETVLWLPAARPDVFRFFSNAANLDALTPPSLRFRIVTRLPIVMDAGTRIEYRVRLHGIPIGWQSEIVVWEPPSRFVDRQLRGPYRRWVHAHTFTAERGGTTVADSVDFAAPFEWLTGSWVMREVRDIFVFRRQTLLRVFAA
jgi:ligand-binding SRPBCC domain-containing protein